MNIAHKLSPRFRDSRDDTDEAQSCIFERPMTEPKLDPVICIVDVHCRLKVHEIRHAKLRLF